MLATLEKDCTTYQVRELDKHEALELFNQHAFRGNKIEEDYFELANQVIRNAGLDLWWFDTSLVVRFCCVAEEL